MLFNRLPKCNDLQCKNPSSHPRKLEFTGFQTLEGPADVQALLEADKVHIRVCRILTVQKTRPMHCRRAHAHSLFRRHRRAVILLLRFRPRCDGFCRPLGFARGVGCDGFLLRFAFARRSRLDCFFRLRLMPRKMDVPIRNDSVLRDAKLRASERVADDADSLRGEEQTASLALPVLLVDEANDVSIWKRSLHANAMGLVRFAFKTSGDSHAANRWVWSYRCRKSIVVDAGSRRRHRRWMPKERTRMRIERRLARSLRLSRTLATSRRLSRGSREPVHGLPGRWVLSSPLSR